MNGQQSQSIMNYRRLGMEIEKLDESTIRIKQVKLINGLILNQKQLHERAKAIFPKCHIIPIVYSLDIQMVTPDWVKHKMKEYGIRKKDLVKQVAIEKDVVSKVLSGSEPLSSYLRAALFYYFLTFELNWGFRSELG